MATRSRTHDREQSIHITDRDRRLLEFVSEHRLVLAAHAQALLDLSAAATYNRLRSLAAAGMLRQHTLFHNQPGCYQITGKGLAIAGSHLPSPRLDLRCYEHDVGVAWLWLAANAGEWGPMRDVLSERRLRSADASPEGRENPYGIRIGGVGPGGQQRLHYPDLLLVHPRGHRVALELELTLKGRTRRERILAAYGADRSTDAVVYLTDSASIARAMRACATSLGVSQRVHVQAVKRGCTQVHRAIASPQLDRQRGRDYAGARGSSSARRIAVDPGAADR